MFQKLVNHNEDIKHLIEKGYAIAFDSNNYMVIRDIPYLDVNRELQTGAIVAKLIFCDEVRVRQDDHQIFFAGSTPYNLDGTPVANFADRAASLTLGPACADVVVQRRFSNKPKPSGKFREFADFYEKIESYVSQICGPAIEAYGATPYTFHVQTEMISDSVFKFRDTLTSRAEITDLAEKFKNDVIAIIGLGGTGAYVLDFLVKTSVREIRAFDRDPFHVHNAFRSPGRVDSSEFNQSKAAIYEARYENFRAGLSATPKFIDGSCSGDLEGVTFAFVCVDKGSSRAEIFDLLISMGIPFIDVGMGLNRKRGAISGQLRITYYSAEQGQRMRDMELAPLVDSVEDVYKTNIQISELNALNACLAVVKYKQLRGFYVEETPYFHLLAGVENLKIIGSSNADEI